MPTGDRMRVIQETGEEPLNREDVRSDLLEFARFGGKASTYLLVRQELPVLPLKLSLLVRQSILTLGMVLKDERFCCEGTSS